MISIDTILERHRLLWCWALAPWILAASLATASETETDERKRILFLGDSLTIGYGLTKEEAYPGVIQKKIEAAGWPFLVTNAGVSGDTTAGGLNRLGWLLKRPADVLVIALGGNDGLRGIDPAATKINLQAIIDLAKEENPDVKLLLAGMEMPENMGKDYVATFQKVFPDLAEANEITFIPFLLKDVGGDAKLNQPDGIHPSAEGQKVLAETVWEALKPLIDETRSQSAKAANAR